MGAHIKERAAQDQDRAKRLRRRISADVELEIAMLYEAERKRHLLEGWTADQRLAADREVRRCSLASVIAADLLRRRQSLVAEVIEARRGLLAGAAETDSDSQRRLARYRARASRAAAPVVLTAGISRLDKSQKKAEEMQRTVARLLHPDRWIGDRRLEEIYRESPDTRQRASDLVCRATELREKAQSGEAADAAVELAALVVAAQQLCLAAAGTGDGDEVLDLDDETIPARLSCADLLRIHQRVTARIAAMQDPRTALGRYYRADLSPEGIPGEVAREHERCERTLLAARRWLRRILTLVERERGAETAGGLLEYFGIDASEWEGAYHDA